QAQEAQQAGDLAHAEEQHPGGVGVEGAGVPDLAGAEEAPGPGHDVVAGPARLLVDDGQPVAPAAGATTTHYASSRRQRSTSSRRAAPRITSRGRSRGSGVCLTRA